MGKIKRSFFLILLLIFNFCSNLTEQEQYAKKILEEESALFNNFSQNLKAAKEKTTLIMVLQNFQNKFSEFSVRLAEFETKFPEYSQRKEVPVVLKTEWQKLVIAKAKATQALLAKLYFFSEPEIAETLRQLAFIQD